MKDNNEVIHEFNDLVNMTVPELEKWLKTGDSTDAGWSKDDGSGESVGHDSGRRIIEILKSNPDKKPDNYTEDQLSHMRKVVSYCKRHLAQEERANQEKPVEEVKKTKSYASLKNWGHDPLKKRKDAGNDEADEDEEDGEEQVGDKRKKSSNDQAQSNKKRETRQGKGTSNGQKKADKEDGDEEEDEDNENDEDDDEGEDANGNDDEGDDDDEDGDGDDKENGKSSSKKPKKGPKPGETVSWAWGGGNPEGKVLDVKAEDTTITTKRGSKVTRKADAEDPAVVLDTGKSKAVKSNHELD